MPTRASDRVTLAVVASPTYVRTYYRMQASNLAAPAVPTTNPPASPWTTTEPAYTAGSTDTLYTVQLIAYGSAAFEYGPVQKSAAFEAAKQAYNLAQTANNGQAAVPRPLHGTAVPTTNSPTAPNGSVYFRHQGALDGPIIASYSRASGVWVETPVMIRAGQIQVGALDGLEIFGGTVGTGRTGRRVILAGNEVSFWDENDQDAGYIYGVSGGSNGGLIVVGRNPEAGLTIGHQALPEGGSVQLSVFAASARTLHTDGLYSYEHGSFYNPVFRGTTSQRDAAFGPLGVGPVTSGELAAHAAQLQWFNTDTGCLEQFYSAPANSNVPANSGFVSKGGWYPIAGKLPSGRAWKSGGAHSFGFPNDNTLIGTGNVLWQSGGLVYQSSSDSWVLPHAGRYRMRADMMFSSSNGNITTTIRNHDTGEAYKVQFARPQGNHFERFDFEAVEVLAGGTRLRASVAGSSINAVCERNTWHVGVEYLGPPFI